jgi:soluble P-type ATPase
VDSLESGMAENATEVRKGGPMISVDIPGWGNMEIENVVIDLNGTLATDGKIPPEVKKKISSLAGHAKIYVLTADTQGTATEEVQEMKVELIKIEGKESKEGKFNFLKTLNLDKTVAIGNGSNDQFILKEAGLGIAVLGDEGISITALRQADVMVKHISDALDLLLKPNRLTATLRE